MAAAALSRRPRVSIVGVGAMGAAVAGRLLDVGHEVVVWNRTTVRTAPLAAAGAMVATSPAAAAAESDVCVLLVSDESAARAVMAGADGVAAADRSGLVVVLMSTVGVQASNDLHALLTHAGFVDAPVLGSITEAERGELTVLAGGSDEADDAVGVLSALGRVVRVGPVGAGQAAKLVANSALFAVVTALGETIAFADAVGLPRDIAYDVLAQTALGPQAERRRAAVESGDYAPRFALSLAHKDAALARHAAVAAGRPDLRVLAGAGGWLEKAVAAGLSARDYTAVLELITRSRR